MKKYFTIFLFCVLMPLTDIAQNVMFQGWTWQYPILYNGQRYSQRIGAKARDLGKAGFTHIWVPPLSRGSGGSGSMGYDISDLYDLGEHAGMVRAGSRSQIDAMVDSFTVNNIEVVADMVFNHRDKGKPENNGAVEGWIRNFSNNGDCPYPSGNFRCILPLGGNSGNGAGDYYFKFSSASANPAFDGRTYNVTAWTNKKPIDGSSKTEIEPNGGGDCAQPFDTLNVGQKIELTIENATGVCGTDEILIRLDTADFHSTGDTLFIIMPNTTLNLGYYTDHRIYGVWSAAASGNIVDSLYYQTYTDFSTMPSGRGGMHYWNFKPNGAPTSLCGDYDGMWFFYDYDQNQQSTRDTLFEWTKWMWQDVGTRGMRVDAIKHFPPDFIGDLLDYLHDNNIDPRIFVGEYFDYNAFTLKGWIDAVLNAMDADTKQAIHPQIFDFPLRNALKSACDQFGYDVRNVFNESLRDKAGVSGFDVITFVENHDFDNENHLVENDPKLAYAYILTNNQLGTPCVFEKNYYGPPTDTANNIRSEINALMKVHQKYIYGAEWVDYLSRVNTPYYENFISGYPNTTLLYQLSNTISGRDVLVCINFAGDTLKLDHNINGTNLHPGDTITDIFGVSPYPTNIVGQTYGVYLQVPPRSFGVWVEGDLTDSLINITPSTSILPPFYQSDNFSVAPNPFEQSLTLTLSGQEFENAKVEIWDISGKKVWESALPQHESEFVIRPELSHQGIYILKMTSGEKQYIEKIVFEK
ncbi:MAG: T9SS type A sorting domain-containing protein [Bacteroidia bacterium]|nr:T9SS type A sorting domain-containing protein [Bacteroidia bacterium]